MGSCTSKEPNNPLSRQFKISRQRFTKMELHLLKKIFNDLSSRSKGETMAKDDFLRFFPLTGLWGDRMFERFDLMKTGNINLEEFIIGLANSAKLTQEESIKYLFNVYDLTNDNCITKSELLMMLYNYPQEDLKQITKDPYFSENQKKMNQEKQLKDEPSFNATSQFFQSQIQDFMHGRNTITNLPQASEYSQKSILTQQIKHQKPNDEEDTGDPEPTLNAPISKRQITRNASESNPKTHKFPPEPAPNTKKNSLIIQNPQQNISSNTSSKKNSVVIHQGNGNGNGSQSNFLNSSNYSAQQHRENTVKKHTNVPIKASNITNIIKQFCDFVFREFNTDRLTYDMFRQWSLENKTLFNIFTETFYFSFWGEIEGEMEYKLKKLDMSGYLYKLKQNKEYSLKKYYYELRDNFLIYFTEKDQKPKGMLCMDGLIVKEKSANEYENNNQLKNLLKGRAGFEIYHKDEFYKSKHLYCSLEERKQWMDTLVEYSKSSFQDRYELREKIGVGRFSAVYKGFKKTDKNEKNNTEYAIKVMLKKELSEEEIQFISYETETMKYLNHPGIINVYETFEDKNNIYIVTELVSDGDLFQYIHSNEFLEEVEVSVIMKQLMATILYIHDAGILHRDLKPENIMVVKQKEKEKEINGMTIKQIKIIDFGFSKMLQLGQQCEGFCGSQNYLAPEVIKNMMYDQKVDNFALGCIMFFMLRGSLPFDSWDPDEINQNTIEGKFSLVDDHWNNVSPQAKDLIQGLLKVDPEDRITLREALQHEFITNRKQLEKYKDKNPHGIWDQKSQKEDQSQMSSNMNLQ